MRWRFRVSTTGALGLALLVLVLLLAIAQLVLPRIAARVLRDKVARYGQVQSASVYALPALQLLWGSADSAKLDARRIKVSPGQLIALLVESKPLTDLTVRAHEVDLVHPGFGAGTVSLSDVTLHKRGQSLYASALLSNEALRQALPLGMRIHMSTAEGDGVQVRASGQLFGFTAAISARVHAAEGKLVLSPTQPALAGLAKITLFSDPRIEVESVTATEEGSDSHAAWLLHVRARLR